MCLSRPDQVGHQMLVRPDGQALDLANQVGGHDLADRNYAADKARPANDEATHLPTAIQALHHRRTSGHELRNH